MKTFNMFILNEQFSTSMINKLKKAYEPMRGKRISSAQGQKLMGIIDKVDKKKDVLIQLYKADIPFVSQLALSRLIQKHNMKGVEINKLGKISKFREYNSYPTGGASTGPGMGQYRPVADLNASTDAYRKSLEQIAKDRQMKSLSKKDRDTLMKISKMLAKEKKSK